MTLSLLCVGILSCREERIADSQVGAERDGEMPPKTDEVPAPGFELQDMEGNTVSLQSFRGRVVLLNFWATWCAPCVAEMPALSRLAESVRGHGVEVVAINVDGARKKEDVRKFIAEQGIRFPILLDPTYSAAQNYGVTGFPESVVIDRAGLLRAVIDPESGERVLKFIGDRPWDAPPFRAMLLGVD